MSGCFSSYMARVCAGIGQTSGGSGRTSTAKVAQVRSATLSASPNRYGLPRAFCAWSRRASSASTSAQRPGAAAAAAAS